MKHITNIWEEEQLERGLYLQFISSDADLAAWDNLFLCFRDTDNEPQIEDSVFSVISALFGTYRNAYMKKAEERHRFSSWSYGISEPIGPQYKKCIEISNAPVSSKNCYSFAITMLEKLSTIDSLDRYCEEPELVIRHNFCFDDFESRLTKANQIIKEFLAIAKSQGECRELPSRYFR